MRCQLAKLQKKKPRTRRIKTTKRNEKCMMEYYKGKNGEEKCLKGE